MGRQKEDAARPPPHLGFLGTAELHDRADQLLDLYNADPKTFAKMKRDELEKKVKSVLPRSVDIALFGRMTTSATFEDVQAAAQVAHAISTTRVEHQFDYFTAVDDLKTDAEEDRGAGMIGGGEFNSATYYKYFPIDVPSLPVHPGGDAGTPIVVSHPNSASAKAFLAAAEKLAAQISIQVLTEGLEAESDGMAHSFV